MAVRDLKMSASGRIDFKNAGIWLGLMLLLLGPAWLNGFPLVMDDSISYSGQGAGWIRSNTAAVLIAPLYSQLGYWALPLFNAVLVSSAWLLVCRSFSMPDLFMLTLPLAALSLQPLYASAVLVDSWFFAAVVFIILAVRHGSPLLALLAGILLSGHASGVLLIAPFGVLVLVVFHKPKMLLMPLMAIIASLLIGRFLEHKYYPEMPRLSQTFVASRLFSADPQLLRDECSRSGYAVLCDAADYVASIRAEPEHAGRRDFFWDVAKHFGEDFDLKRFELEHARPIVFDALRRQPGKVAGIVLSDFLSFYAAHTSLDFIPKLSEPMPDAFYRSGQAGGFWQQPGLETVVTTLRYMLYATVLTLLVAGWRNLQEDERRWIIVLGLLSLGNDVLFAALSGPPDRYHHRILPLLALIGMISIAAIRRRAHGKAAGLTPAASAPVSR